MVSLLRSLILIVALGRRLSVIAPAQVRNCPPAKTEMMPHGILRRLQLIRDYSVLSSSRLSVGGQILGLHSAFSWSMILSPGGITWLRSSGKILPCKLSGWRPTDQKRF